MPPSAPLRRALTLRPGDLKIQAFLRELYTSQVRPWHFRMMNDTARSRAYDAAIRRAAQTDHAVLEIGTGSGLLSMMAARAGAAWSACRAGGVDRGDRGRDRQSATASAGA